VFKDTLRTPQDVIVPVPKDMKAPRRQIVVAPDIGFALVVLSTIGLYDQAMLITHKIDYPGSNRHLPTKLGSRKSTVP